MEDGLSGADNEDEEGEEGEEDEGCTSKEEVDVNKMPTHQELVEMNMEEGVFRSLRDCP